MDFLFDGKEHHAGGDARSRYCAPCAATATAGRRAGRPGRTTDSPPLVQAAVAAAGFMAFLAEVGAERDNAQQSKRRRALSY